MATDAGFYARFARTVEEDPGAPCVVTDGGTALTRAQLAAASARYAHGLAELGCEPGDRVLVQVDKSPAALALYLACLRAGLVFLPANPAYRPAELAHLRDDARPRVVVSEGDADADAGAGAGAGAVGLSLDELDTRSVAADETFPAVVRDAEETAALLYTSGTTGRPKGAMLSHRAMSWCAQTLGEAWEFSADDVLLHALPLFHGHGLFVSCNVALAAGAALRFHPRFDAAAIVDALPDATVFMGVPTYYHRLLGVPELSTAGCSAIRLFTCGSAPLSAAAAQQFTDRTGHEIVERYGLTEAMILCSNPVRGERRRGSVGPALPGLEVRVADDAQRMLGADAIGEIQARGPGLFSGYWESEEATAEALTADGFFRTGDLGSLSEDGYLTITGRSKDLIISGGYNVYPAEVEAAIDELAAVAESAVVAAPDPDFGEAVCAYVVVAEGAAAPSSAEVIALCKSRLANYKVPKRVEVIDALPRNTMGKVLKSELRDAARRALPA